MELQKEKIKILIVDDSAFMRKALSLMLNSDPEFEIVGYAKDGIEAYEMTKSLRPDIVTLDIEMPKMDGLTALQKIMQDCPTNVLMVSSLTNEGADATIKSFEYGAVDFIPKSRSYISIDIVNIKEELLSKIKKIARQKELRERLLKIKKFNGAQPNKEILRTSLPKIGYKSIAIGISTGGPLSLQKVIPYLSEKINVPIFIVQHMPPRFTKSLADRLNDLSKLKVKEAEDQEIVQNGTVYFVPGGMQIQLIKNSSNEIQIFIKEEPINSLYKPSVDIMLETVVDIYGKYALAVIMTGMGKDGLEGVKKLKRIGGYSIAQDESTSVVYGMPKVIAEANLADVIAPLDKIPNLINEAIL